MWQPIAAFGIVVAAVSGFIYWLIKANQKSIAARYKDRLQQSEGADRANEAGDQVMAENLGTDAEWLANKQRLHDARTRDRQAEEG